MTNVSAAFMVRLLCIRGCIHLSTAALIARVPEVEMRGHGSGYDSHESPMTIIGRGGRKKRSPDWMSVEATTIRKRVGDQRVRSCLALSTACVREWTPSLERMFVTWFLTVPSVI